MGYPDHLKQNYIIDVLVPTIRDVPNIRTPWNVDFATVFDSLGDPVNEGDMQIDTRKPGAREAGIEEDLESED